MQDLVMKQKYRQKKALLCEIAHLYYVEDMNQQEIAKKLNVGRSSIARYLTEAKEQGIVQIRIAEANEAYRVPTLEMR